MMFVSILDRILRHWFLFIFVFGLYCAMIAGAAGLLYGVPNLFVDDPALGKGWDIALFSNGPLFLSQFAATTLIGMIWLMVSLLDAYHSRGNAVASFWIHFKYLMPRLFFGALFPLAAAAYALLTTLADVTMHDFARALLGSLAGMVFVTLNLFAAHFINKFVPVRIVFLIMGLVVAFLIVLTLIPKLIPAISIAIVLGWFVVIYGMIGLLPMGARPLAVVGIIALISVSNGTQFKYGFDGIVDASGRSYYETDKQVRLYTDPDQQVAQAAEMVNPLIFQRRIVKKRSLRRVEKAQQDLINPVQALRAWKRRTGEDRPKLVVVSTSGGAYRAAFWTALVLDKIGAQSRAGGSLEGLDKHINLITGASGGMVSAAYFAAGRQPSGETLVFDNIQDQLQLDIASTALEDRFGTRFPIPRDSLSTVTQQLVQRDIFHLFDPRTQNKDRGKVLESHWKTLNVKFSDMAFGESAGWRPSLIFSPMIVETGQPMLISNLDLADIRVEAPQPMMGKGVRSVIRDIREKSREDKLKETVEFFKLFPGSNKAFRVNTAARMSASFAYISPAVELPTIPARRIVDAGYYDNYGVSIAIAYLKQPDIMRWILNNTSGVIVIQIRAYPSVAEEDDDDRFETASDESLADSGQRARCEEIKLSQILSREPTWMERAFHWITSPLEGRETARQASMLFRNNQELRLLQSLYPKDFLQTVAFENAASISLNWYLPEHEMRCLERELGKSLNVESFEELSEIWNG